MRGTFIVTLPINHLLLGVLVCEKHTWTRRDENMEEFLSIRISTLRTMLIIMFSVSAFSNHMGEY